MIGKAIIFSAPSGSGKTTIVRALLEQGDFPLAFSISATSRAPRGQEKEGESYYFLSPAGFKEAIAKKELLEWEEVYADQFYGTLKREVDRIWSEGKHVLFDVDVVGGLKLKEKLGDRALAVFIQPPSINALRERLEKRKTESKEKIAMRLAKAEEELARASEFDTIILNDQLDKAVADTQRAISAFLTQSA